jgi:hypothetical protein
LDELFALEKQTRLGNDVKATEAVTTAIIEICRSTNDWKLLNSNVLTISKRRGQLKQVCGCFMLAMLNQYRADDSYLSLGAYQNRPSLHDLH